MRYLLSMVLKKALQGNYIALAIDPFLCGPCVNLIALNNTSKPLKDLLDALEALHMHFRTRTLRHPS